MSTMITETAHVVKFGSVVKLRFIVNGKFESEMFGFEDAAQAKPTPPRSLLVLSLFETFKN